MATRVLHIGEKNITKKRDIPTDWALSHFSKCTAIEKARRRFRDRDRGVKDINQVLREQDKMKEDVIASLSDKLIMLSERLDAL